MKKLFCTLLLIFTTSLNSASAPISDRNKTLEEQRDVEISNFWKRETNTDKINFLYDAAITTYRIFYLYLDETIDKHKKKLTRQSNLIKTLTKEDAISLFTKSDVTTVNEILKIKYSFIKKAITNKKLNLDDVRGSKLTAKIFSPDIRTRSRMKWLLINLLKIKNNQPEETTIIEPQAFKAINLNSMESATRSLSPKNRLLKTMSAIEKKIAPKSDLKEIIYERFLREDNKYSQLNSQYKLSSTDIKSFIEKIKKALSTLDNLVNTSDNESVKRIQRIQSELKTMKTNWEPIETQISQQESILKNKYDKIIKYYEKLTNLINKNFTFETSWWKKLLKKERIIINIKENARPYSIISAEAYIKNIYDKNQEIANPSLNTSEAQRQKREISKIIAATKEHEKQINSIKQKRKIGSR